MLKFTLFIALAAVVYADYERTLSAELDPFCEPSAKCGLCYVQAEGPSDTVHHFWATFGSPAVLSVHTQPGVRLLNVSWHRLRKRDFSVAAFRFSEEPIVSSAVVLSKLWEYKDVGNMAKVDPHLANGTHSVSLGDLVWGDVSGCEGNGSNVVVATFTANSSTLKDDAVYFSKNGTVEVTVRVQSTPGRQDQLPHLLYTSNSTQLEVSLLGLATKLGDDSQFGLELTALDESPVNWTLTVDQRSSFDDEYTPGVFTNVAVVPRSNASLTLPTYLHWKPVSYRDGRRTVTLSVDAKNQNLTSGADWWRFNAATAWMAHRAPNVSSTALNLTLGSEGDEHYKKYRYATWSLSAGFGSLPVEQVSTTVIAVTSVGLGIPAIVAIVTVGYLALYKPEPSL